MGEADPVVETAPAKLNLFLRVLGRRDDGYHNVETVILPLSLADQVTVEPIPDDLRVITSGPLAEEVPEGEENLALRAAVRLRDSLRRKDGAKIGIDKRIPVAAGLGGGSADAAATLRVLGQAWSAGDSTLDQVGAMVGSDVPALLEGGPVLVRGRGQPVEPIEVPPTNWVLLTQSFGVSAADAYRWWDEDGGPTGPHPQPVIDALRAGDLEVLHGLLFNDLERSVSRRHPEIVEAIRQLLEAGALAAIMCGSGPTVAGLCRDEGHAQAVAREARGTPVTTVRGLLA